MGLAGTGLAGTGLAGRARALLRRPSRVTGLVLLAIGLALQIWAGPDGPAWRTALWDQLHRLAPRDRGPAAEAPAIVVAIDEETMRQNGPWPWPRNRLAELVERIADLGAAAVVLDLVLDNPDPQSPAQLAAEYRARGIPEAAEALEPLGDTDAVLFAALRSVPSVLPVAGISGALPGRHGLVCDFPPPPVSASAPLPELAGVYYLAVAPLPGLLERAPGLAELGLGAINFRADRGFVVRRVEAVQRICGDLVLMPGAEALRIATGGFFATVRPSWSGLEVVLGDPADPGVLRFPTERDGTFWLHFGPLGDHMEVGARYMPAHRLFHPNFDAARLAGRIVFVAVLELGAVDERLSPVGQVIYGVETHVQMVEQILSGRFLRRPWFMDGIEATLMLLGCLSVIALVPAARPELSAGVIAAGIAALIAGGYLAFRAGILLDAATPAIGVFVTTAGVLTATLIERDRARLVSELALVKARADRARLQGELDAAALMQRALLPAPRLHRPGLDLAAHLEPARVVGGDFYDHFMLDDRHLFFMVADVSDKGALASQFMLVSRTVWKGVALRSGPALADIQRQANAGIAVDNPEQMFVTGFCGLLDLATGELAYSSAGHDAPFLFGSGRAPVQLAFEAGPPVGLIDGAEYPVFRCRLAPGDRLCLFSDGVTEAMDAEGRLFGLDRLRTTLADSSPQADSAGIVAQIVARIAAFTGDAEKSDDLTLMVLSVTG